MGRPRFSVISSPSVNARKTPIEPLQAFTKHGKGDRFIIRALGPSDACQLTAILAGASLIAKAVMPVPRCTTTVLRPHRQVELRHARAR